jgi:hypothetical protein
MKKIILAVLTLIAITGCGAIEGHKYLFTGKEGTPPPRTITAAKAKFNDDNLIIGKTTEADIKRIFGSPSSLKNKNGMKVYSYVKSVGTKGISSDPGTIYLAEYTFAKNGKLSQSNYSARPMRNPLLN